MPRERLITLTPTADTNWAQQHCSGCDARGEHRLTFDGTYLSLCTSCAQYLRTLLPEPAPVERTPFPADGICPECGSDSSWVVVEDGYMRWTSAEMDPGAQGGSEHDQLAPFLAAYPNGSSDYSEGGTDQWIECATEKCEGVYASPDHVTFS